MDALHAPLDLRHVRRAGDRARRGRLPLRRARASATSTGWPGSSSASWATGAPSWPTPPPKQARELAFMPLWSYAHPRGHRAGRAGGGLRPRRPEPGLLHQRRRRGRRDRLEARQELLQARRQADEAQGDQPGDRLPRHHPGRAVDHRAAAAQAAVRAAGALDVPGAEHQRLPRLRDDRRPARRQRRGGLRPLGRRPDRDRDRERGPRHRRGRLPRAGAERRRLLPAPGRLLPAGARDLRRVRRAAGLRRGDLRVRPARPHVRRGALRLPARHDHLRQGHSPPATPRSAR